MLEAETEAGDYWKKCGDDALAQNVTGIVMMVSATDVTTHLNTGAHLDPGRSLGLPW
jgi:hypothetical protein